jgi:hypothetical protein
MFHASSINASSVVLATPSPALRGGGSERRAANACANAGRMRGGQITKYRTSSQTTLTNAVAGWDGLQPRRGHAHAGVTVASASAGLHPAAAVRHGVGGVMTHGRRERQQGHGRGWKRAGWQQRGRRDLPVTAVLPTDEALEAAQRLNAIAIALVFGGLAVGLGLKGEPEPCPACAQRGGEACIFCDATGRREAPIKVSKRDANDDSIMGLTRRSPMECTAGHTHAPQAHMCVTRTRVTHTRTR